MAQNLLKASCQLSIIIQIGCSSKSLHHKQIRNFVITYSKLPQKEEPSVGKSGKCEFHIKWYYGEPTSTSSKTGQSASSGDKSLGQTNYPSFMEMGGSSSRSQQSANASCLNKMNPVNILIPRFFKINILPSTVRSFKWSLSFTCFGLRLCINFSSSLCVLHVLTT